MNKPTLIQRARNVMAHVTFLAIMCGIALASGPVTAYAQDVEPVEVVTASQWSTFVSGIGTALTGPITSVLSLAFGLLIVSLVVRTVKRYAFKG